MGEKQINEFTIKDMVLSFTIFGVFALVCIGIWKRQHTMSFLLEIFNPSNLLFSSFVGIGCGIIIAILVAIIARITKTTIPKDKNNDLLVDFMKKPHGPIVVGMLPGIFEELFFRGFLLALFLSFWSPALAIGVSTAIFWLVHVPQYKTNVVLNGTVIGLSVIISILFVEFGTLWAPMLVHGIYNYLITVFIQKGIVSVY